VIGLALVGLHGVPAEAQRCRELHYRWTQKVDTALADLAPLPASVAAMLATWTPPDLGPRDRCAARSEREREVYDISAWVRRVVKLKDDGDWHVELTERSDSPPTPASWSRSRPRNTASATRGPGRRSTR